MFVGERRIDPGKVNLAINPACATRLSIHGRRFEGDLTKAEWGRWLEVVTINNQA